MNKQLHLLVLVLAFVACNRNNDVPIPKPAIVAAAKANDTLQAGQSIVLHPALKGERNGMTYAWRVNGALAGTDSVYTFEAKDRGDFRIVFQATNAGGIDSTVYNLKVYGDYENGFYLLNEGWFGHETGSVFYYRYGADTLQSWVYSKVNPDKPLGNSGSTLQYGAMFNGKFYIVVKVGGPLVVADPITLKEIGRVDRVVGGKGVTFVGIDNNRGLIGGSDGIYPINLNNLSTGGKLTGPTGATGNMIKSGDYVFAHTSGDGMLVLDAISYAVVAKPYKATLGFVQGKNGKIYGAIDSLLIGTDPQTLKLDTAKMPFRVVSPFGAWRSVNMAANTKEDIIYIVRPGASAFAYGNRLYRYMIGNKASLAEPFITLPDGQFFYGSGVTYDPRNNELIITTINGSVTGDVNRVLFYDATTGTLKKTIMWTGWYFPAMVVLQP